MTTDGLESPVMDSFPSLLPNSQLPSGILLTFFWFGPNLWVLFHPADSESAVAIDTRNNSPKDLHCQVSAIVFITPISASPHRETPSAQTTTFTQDPENSHRRAHGERTERGQVHHQNQSHGGLWERTLSQQRLGDSSLGFMATI